MANDILKTLIAEAYGEGPEGMRRVAETILNRAAIRGLSPEEVVRQPAQYTGLNSPGLDAKRAWSDPQAIAAAEAAWNLAQEPGDPTGGADHYYAPGTIDEPWWASAMTPKGAYGGHTFYSSRPLPPGELPQVASALSTQPTPGVAPTVPTMPSIDMQQMRRITPPSQLIPDTFGSLPKPSRNLGDTLAMNPVQGGQQQAPMFDAAYDTRTGQMRMTRQPIDSQGIAVGQSKPPAPIPAIPSPQLAARRATDPTLQAALNARYPAQLPPIPGPSTPKVQTAFSYAGQDASKPRPFPTDLQIAAATPFRGGGVPPVPDRLAANVFPQGEAPPVTGVGGRAVAPIPFVRPLGLGNAQALAPVPMPRLSRPAPKIAPMPMPLAMRPAPRPSQPPLRVTVNGGNAPARPTPQGYTDTGNGRLVNDETGGVYYTRHLR